MASNVIATESPQPLISVGLPVRNGAAHIAHALESLLSQTCRDFEVTVYDNASIDATPAIVESFAHRDRRVRLIRHDRDIGGAANFIQAAERAAGSYFCWTAHDDLRESTFLHTLLHLLERHSDAALACCAVRNVDPDGSLRDVRPETASLGAIRNVAAPQRLLAYMRHMPGTPFYGLFRTGALKATLPALRRLNNLAGNGPAILGIDIIFLAHVLRDHGLAYSPQPLLLFRRGGVSHNLGRYGSLREYADQIRLFHREMRRAIVLPTASRRRRMRLRIALLLSEARWLLSRDMRRMSAHYLSQSLPLLSGPRAWLMTRLDPALRRLRSRIASIPGGCRIVIFGAGKHTRRRVADMRSAVNRHGATIVACCDDRAEQCEPIDGLRIIAPAYLAGLNPDVLLVSSDTYEDAMFRRACAIAPCGTHVWALYDATLHACCRAESCSWSSTSAMNDAMSSSVSPVN